jgi:uncharacterized membrane protein YkoI
MRALPERLLILWLCTAFLPGWPVAPLAIAEEAKALQRGDHDVARDALERGEILPLETVLASVRKVFPGEVAGVEIERTSSGWVYEIKVIAPDGAILDIEADAKTGRVSRER